MKLIPLNTVRKTKNYRKHFATVDDDDFEMLNRWDWFVQKDDRTLYAIRTEKINGVAKLIKMHREILGLKKTDCIIIDHIDGDGLNNQRDNLRKATPSQNGANRKSAIGSSSKYLGVHFSPIVNNKNGSFYRKKKWRATINKGGVCFFLGAYLTEDEAAIAYNNKAKSLYGEFANLNIII